MYVCILIETVHILAKYNKGTKNQKIVCTVNQFQLQLQRLVFISYFLFSLTSLLYQLWLQ